MSHALVTIIAPLDEARIAAAEAAIDRLGNPPRPDIIAALDRLDGEDGTHFCSLHAVRSKTIGKAYLAFEFSADGTPDSATARIARAIGPDLQTVFSMASDWQADTAIGGYLVAHRIEIGVGLFDNPGLAFAGTPGLSVGRIRTEQSLAAASRALLPRPDDTRGALEQLERIRAQLAQRPDLADMLETGTAGPPFTPADTASLIGKLLLSFIETYLWPVVILVILSTITGIALAPPAQNAFLFLWDAFVWLLFCVLIAVVLVLVVAAILYSNLRSLEERDAVEERVADDRTLQDMFTRENRYAQNHMISVTQRKPGWVRWFTARLIFWIIGQLAGLSYRPGYLSDIGTIHFARWVTVPGTHDLLFFSNYDASWESYLEDFITKAHAGLTGVWSNSIGFPYTENLIQKGATDGERFKRYARQSMIPTRFWYSAYRTLTTDEIRTNSAIRLGLSGAQTEDEAMRWLALFGSAARPASKLVTSEIQSIIFGGLGKDKPFGTCLLYALPPAQAARAWLASVLPSVAFNDGRRLKDEAVVTLALGPGGLRQLGLPDSALHTFPYAFRVGMTDPTRRLILGDARDNAPESWRWGQTAPDAALLIYGPTPEEVARLEAELAAIATKHGAELNHRIPLKQVAEREPFGFADGISQPLIRGSYKATKADATSKDIVEPGEFILGYPDNRGNSPPGPTLPATADPGNLLPLVETVSDFSRNVVDGTRDLGRNGSYLVIRELEQDTAAFSEYCDQESARLQGHLHEPYHITPEFIASRLVGRWQNGSSTVRHPYLPKSAPHHLEDNEFLFGVEDPEAIRCPFGAHIRRANPRDSLAPGSQDQIDISNRHRIIRIGRQYQPEDGGKPGLLFMCLNADIERQFEFVQQTWLRSPSFHGLSCEKDPLLGDGDKDTCGFTMPTRYGPAKLSPVPAMVATRGGGYFFLPGRRLLEFLAAS